MKINIPASIKMIFPIKRQEWILFALMFLVICLINVNFSVLRSMRNAMVVAGKGGSSSFIPYFELFGTFPASILLTWALSRLMRFFSFRFIFVVTMVFFLSFFVLFALVIYPQKEAIQILLEQKVGQFFGLTRFKVIFTHWPDMVFYIMSELWKVALLSVIFWGFINQNLSLDKAKRFYPSLMLGGSTGAILAGPITVVCTSQITWNLFPLSAHRWQHSLTLLTGCLFLCGLLTLFVFGFLFRKLNQSSSFTPPSKKPLRKKEKLPFSRQLLSLSSSMRYLLKSPYLCALLLLVVAEYISYALGELIFYETLKSIYPLRSDYCKYMGNLTFWTGITTSFFALVLTPYFLQKYRWIYSAMVAPILMVIMTFVFFFPLYCGRTGLISTQTAASLAVFLGSLHFCVGRSIKYTFFDATKELAFIPLDQEGQVKGKLIIDGMGSRLGRGSSSFLSIVLFLFMGGPTESAIFAGIIAISFAIMCIPATQYLGKEFDQLTPAATPVPSAE